MLSRVLNKGGGRLIPGFKRFCSTATATTPTPKVIEKEAYSGAVQFMHWSMGGCVLGCFGFVQLAMNTTDKKLKMDYMFIHKSFGTLGFFLLAPRLLIRATSAKVAPASKVMWEMVAAKVSHYAMYGFLVAMPVSGVVMGYYGGKGLPFFWKTIPGAEKKDGKLAGRAFWWHKNLGWYMEMLFLGHLGGVGFHMLKGETILARILPIAGKKP